MLNRLLKAWLWLLAFATATGCGTTRWSDSARTATEQMLISDAVDRAVSQIDFASLAGRDVYLDGKYITSTVDEKYIIGTLRQHMFASGCIVKDKIEDAAYVVEVRAGAVGTNRNDLLFGIPATTLPAGGSMLPLAPTSIPELSFFKRTAQQGVCKVAVFAYDRESGHPVWQSGIRQQVSKAKDVWVMGTGPFQHGTIYEGTKFAGERLEVPLAPGVAKTKPANNVWVAKEILFNEPVRLAKTVPARPAANQTAGNSSDAPAQAADSAAATSAGPGPPPSVVTTSTYGGATATAYSQAPASPAAGSTQANSATSNPAAGAVGAYQAMDWARTVRENINTPATRVR
jgi:hypothetical protein